MKNLPAWASLALCLLLASPGLQASAADEAELRRIKTELWPKAYREQDTALLARILDESFRFIDGAGAVTTRSDEIEWVRANRMDHEHFEYVIERLDVFDGRSAIVSGMGIIRNTRDGVLVESRYRSTNVFIKRADGWRAVASHVSSLPGP